VPGWHARTRDLVAEGKLAVAGIVQEQHGDRAALFMQWQQMRWPVMVDSLNLLGVRAVPTTLLIDRSGIIRAVNPKDDELRRFLETDYPGDGPEPPAFVPPDEATSLAVATLSGGELDEAIEALAAHTAELPEEAPALFRLGVLLRMRHDSPTRRPADFSAAVAAWGAALKREPGQYIWRRRIQQYGPRLDKPYPFYDWIPTARAAINKRREVPAKLVAEPSGAEIARPGRDPRAEAAAPEHPDQEGKLPEDAAPLIAVRSVAVPSTDPKSPAYRIHLGFDPSPSNRAHWNNESGDSQVWLEVPEGWQSSAVVITLADPGAGKLPVSDGTRSVEFELRPEDGAAVPPPESLRFSAFYYVCEGSDGKCRFLRNDFKVALPGK